MPDSNEFLNLRSQMAWQLREDLRRDELALPLNKKLFAQLVTPKFEKKNGKVVVESKADIMKRSGGKSPNDFDAVMYWNWVRPRKKSADRQPNADEMRDKAPQWNYQRKRLETAKERFYGPDSAPKSSRTTRHITMPRRAR